MFISNKYFNYYFNIVTQAKSRILDINVYYEKHHIVPKSFGGSNKKENLVCLTAREHFVCHQLLVRITTGRNRQKMVHALWRMCNSLKKDYKVSSRTYQKSKEEHAIIMSTVGTSGQFKVGRAAWNRGKPQTAEIKEAVSKANKGRKNPNRTSESFTKEWKEKISNSKKGKDTWNKGISHSAEAKDLMSLKAKQRVKRTCPYCKIETSPSNYARWHGANCRNVNTFFVEVVAL